MVCTYKPTYLLIMKKRTLAYIPNQAVKRKTCHCVGCTRIVTSLHVWPSTPHWGVKQVIVKAKRPRPTCHCLRMHLGKEAGQKTTLVCWECEEKLGAHTHKSYKNQTDSGMIFRAWGCRSNYLYLQPRSHLSACVPACGHVCWSAHAGKGAVS